MLCSHEDAASWASGYKFLRDIAGKKPRFRMGDGAPEITKAGEEVIYQNLYYKVENIVFLGVWRIWFLPYVLATCISECCTQAWTNQEE